MASLRIYILLLSLSFSFAMAAKEEDAGSQAVQLTVQMADATAVASELSQISDGSPANKSREGRRMGELPLLIIRPMNHAHNKRKIYVQEMPSFSHLKGISSNTINTVRGLPEFYVKEGEIFSLEKMLPFFGIDSSHGFQTNVKKGSYAHYLSSSNHRPVAAKYEAPKYEAPKYEAPKYEAPKYDYQQKYKQNKFKINPIPINMNMMNMVKPVTEDVQEHVKDLIKHSIRPTKEAKFPSVMEHNLGEYTPQHNPNFSPLTSNEIRWNKDNVIVGKASEHSKPQPPKKDYKPNSFNSFAAHSSFNNMNSFNNLNNFHNMNKNNQFANSVVKTSYYSPKTINYVPENKPKFLPYQQHKEPHFSQSKHHNYNVKPKTPPPMFRHATQVEYFIPQEQNFAEIDVHTDMIKSFQVENYNPADKNIEPPQIKFHSNVKYNKPVAIEEQFFDVPTNHKSNSKVMQPMHTSIVSSEQHVDKDVPFLIYQESTKNEYLSRPSTLQPEQLQEQPESRPLFHDITVETTTPDHFSSPSSLSSTRKYRKRSRKTTSTTFQPEEDDVNVYMDIATTRNPFSCEVECIKKLNSNKDYDPVCGSDSKTYSSKSKLRCSQTCGRNDLTIKSFGICGKSEIGL